MSEIETKLKNLRRAFNSLERSLATPPTEERDYAGIIQNFEFVYELTWKALKAVLYSQGIDASFPRVVFEESYRVKLLEGNEIWKKIIEARNLSTHTYDPKLAHQLVDSIRDEYFEIFKLTLQKIENFKMS